MPVAVGVGVWITKAGVSVVMKRVGRSGGVEVGGSTLLSVQASAETASATSASALRTGNRLEPGMSLSPSSRPARLVISHCHVAYSY